MAEGDPKDWERRLTAASVPCSTVYSIEEITAHPQVEHRGLLQEVTTPFGLVRLVGAGFRLAHGQNGISGTAAMVGEHTEELLAQAGYEPAAIRDLRARAVI